MYLHLSKTLVLLFLLGISSITCGGAKNVILVIGDGMSHAHLGLLSYYGRYATNDYTIYHEKMAQKGICAAMMTSPAGFLVADSGASATQIAGGVPALPESIGIAADGTPIESVTVVAQNAGKAVGIVSDTHLTHATPAAFLAYWPHRGGESIIAEHILESGADVLLSGGLYHFLPASVTDTTSQVHAEMSALISDAFPLSSARRDERNLFLEAAEKGYSLAATRADMAAVEEGKVLGLFAPYSLPNAMTEEHTYDDPDRTIPTLREMTQHALRLLSQNTNGFFLMVEVGQIDWAAHQNDAGLLLREMFRFNDVLEEVYAFARENTDTLILVTSDHDTGGFAINYTSYDRPEPMPYPGERFADHTFGPGLNFQTADILHLIAQQKRPLMSLVGEFLSLSSRHRTPERLRDMVRETTGYPFTLEDAYAVLTYAYTPPIPGRHEVLLPQIHEYHEFYNLCEHHRISALIARRSARYTGISWASGMHTHIPVPVVGMGPVEALTPFNGFYHATDFGQKLKDAVRNTEALKN